MATSPQMSLGLRDYFGMIRRRLLYVIGIAPSILGVSILSAFWIRPLYQSTATILLQSSSVAKDVVQTTVASDADTQIEVVQGRVLTPEIVSQLVQDYDPYPNDRTSAIATKAQRVLDATSIEKVDPVTYKPTTDATNTFSLHYNNPDRARASAVAGRLAQLFLTYHQRERVQAARGTAAFLQQQASSVDHEIAAVDTELARLKTTQGDALPELRDQNQATIERTEHSIDSLQQEILAAESKEAELSVQLGQMSPNLITQSGDLSDLSTVRAKLAEAEQRYTPDHPEVKRLKRALEMLAAQTAKPTSGGIVASATNPQYVITATELESARRQLASLRAEAAKEHNKLSDYEELLRRTPGVERTEADILRRRQSLQTEYQQIQDRLQNAREAQSFESEQRGEHFVMLQAPEIARSPISPNRPGLISIGLLLGLGLAAAAVAIAEGADVHIRHVGDLPEIDAPLLTTIPEIRNAHDRQRRRLLVLGVGFAYGLAILAVGAVAAKRIHHDSGTAAHVTD